MPDGLTFTFHGVRGSSAIDRADSSRYGGATTCISAPLGPGHYLVLDVGSGLRGLQSQLPAEDGLRFTFLISHFHLDHLLGLPFFRPLYRRGTTMEFYAMPWEHVGVEAAISGMMSAPLFPVPLDAVRSTTRFIDAGDDAWEVGSTTVRAARLYHPQGVTAYRIESGGRSLVFATDVEVGDAESDKALIDLAGEADFLIHDAQYLPEEQDRHRGWGHSTWEQAAEIAEQAGVGRLILTHHDPTRSDAAIDALLARARERFPNTDAAYKGMQVAV